MSYREWVEDFETNEEITMQTLGSAPYTPVKPQAKLDPKYQKLHDVLRQAYDQAAAGKGAERHATGQAFHEQPMQTISDMVGSVDGMAFQAIKKIQESKRLPTRDAQVRELLGAINYIAGMVIFIEKQGE